MGIFPKYIWIKNKRLYFYDSFRDYNQVKKIAKYYQRKLKNSYFIITSESFFTGNRVYGLFMNKVYRPF